MAFGRGVRGVRSAWASDASRDLRAGGRAGRERRRCATLGEAPSGRTVLMAAVHRHAPPATNPPWWPAPTRRRGPRCRSWAAPRAATPACAVGRGARPRRDSVVAVAMRSPRPIGVGHSHGCSPCASPSVVTKRGRPHAARNSTGARPSEVYLDKLGRAGERLERRRLRAPGHRAPAGPAGAERRRAAAPRARPRRRRRPGLRHAHPGQRGRRVHRAVAGGDRRAARGRRSATPSPRSTALRRAPPWCSTAPGGAARSAARGSARRRGRRAARARSAPARRRSPASTPEGRWAVSEERREIATTPSWSQPSPEREAAATTTCVRRFVEASRRAEIIALVNSAVLGGRAGLRGHATSCARPSRPRRRS